MGRELVRALVAAFVLCATPGVVMAQADDSRHLFELGQAAHTEGRFAEARDHLRASLELSPRVATAFNLGLALRGTGETIAALNVFESLLDGEYGTVSEGARSDAEVLQQELRGEVATLVVHFPGSPQARLFIDGRSRGVVDDGAQLELNAGSHTFVAESAGRRSERVQVDLTRGANEPIELSLPDESGTLVLTSGTGDVEIVGVARAPLTLTRQLSARDYEVVWWDGDDAERRHIAVLVNEETRVSFTPDHRRRRRWILALVGVVVVAAAATAIIATRPVGEATLPTNDDVFGVTQALQP